MDVLRFLCAQAMANKQRIVLPEATEERTLRAADRALADGLAHIILIGNPSEIIDCATSWGLTHINEATIVDPEYNELSEQYALSLYELRKNKGLKLEQAHKLIKNPLYLGCMLIKNGEADGQISGALSTTSDTLRPALQIIKCAPGINCVSGAMILLTHSIYGEEGVVVMGDVAVTPVPDANQLAQIAICTAQTAKSIAQIKKPKVAMLSFSTKGSATHESIDKVVEALKLAKIMAPDLDIDGELQADAALVPAVGKKKAPRSTIAGEANVLIAPCLEVGNIGYKLVERLGDAKAIGPILQGIARPVNDLSRGCSIEDIYYMVAITACQAIDAKSKE